MSDRLPVDEEQRLSELRLRGSLPQLRLRVRSLRDAGWSFQSIATPLKTYRSTVRAWSLHEDYDRTIPTLTDVPMPSHALIPRLLIDPARYQPDTRLPLLGVMGIAPKLSHHNAVLLRTLSQDARRVRGHTATNARSRTSARKFDTLLRQERSRGVSIQELAVASNLTTRAVRTRIQMPLDAPIVLTNLDPIAGPFLLIWEARSLTQRWRTFVLQGSRKPIVFSPGLVSFPATLPKSYHVLSPAEAERQLGWPESDNVYFPEPDLDEEAP